MPSPLFIRLAAGSFDPLQSLPQLPERLSYTPAEAAAAGAYIVQFSGPVMQEWKQAIVKAGGQLGDYVPDDAFLVHLDAAAQAKVEALSFVRWVGPYHPAYKLAPDVDYKDARSYRIILAPWADAISTQAALDSLVGESRSFSQGFSVVLNGEQLDQVARLPEVVWIEPYHLQQLYSQRSNNDVGGGTIMGGTSAWASGYTGNGVTIAVADTGLDTGNPSSIHLDFSGRVAHISSWPVIYANYGGGCAITNAGADDGAADKESGHGSHVTGSVAGNGARSSGQFKGLGYEASITFQAVEQWTTWQTPDPGSCPNGYYLTGIPDDVRTLLNEVYGWGARIQNDSWGGGTHGVYDQQSNYFDDFIHQHPDMTVVVAAGNDGVDANADGYVDENSISSPATAKNVISVGASENERTSGGYAAYTWGQGWPSDYPANPTRDDLMSDSREELAAFSSRGPMNDGRIKPDVVAPGTNIISVRSSQATENGWGPYNTYYMYMGGTSMASPLTAGAATLVRDYYIDHEGRTDPSAALIKATLINSAVDITGYGNTSQEAGQPIPNNHEGWGRVNVAAATTPNKRQFVDNTSGIGTGTTAAYTYYASAGQPFKVSLVWSDYPGAAYASPVLVNNLNLRVTAPNGSTIYWGNHFSGGWSQTGGSADTVNNVENVYVQSPTTGNWKVEVIGQNVPNGPQPFALVVNGNISTVQPLAVTSINPTSAPNNATLNGAVIRGAGFEAASVVHLVHNATTIPGTSLTVNTVSDIITATFNLNGAAPGLWDVRVTNSGSVSATLKNAFTVIDATKPDLAISKTAAKDTMDPGGWLTYTIAINNHGYATATGIVFTDTLPGGVVFGSLSPTCSGGRITLPGGFACRVQLASMPVGSRITYTLIVSVPSSVRGSITNNAVVASSGTDASSSDNSDQVSVIVGQISVYLPIILKSSPQLPNAPALNPVSPNPSTDGSYTVSWVAGGGPAPTSYDLEENGSIILLDYASVSYNASGKADGTYTYRVRGKNGNGVGAWSSSQSVTVQQSASGPTPGFWESATGDEFYVTTDRAYVDNFAIYISVQGCGNYKITRTTPVPIVNNQFSFSGSFYASGTFNSSTTASGTDGLNQFNITGCGKISGGPWDWAAIWKNSSQPAFMPAIIVGPDSAETIPETGHSFYKLIPTRSR